MRAKRQLSQSAYGSQQSGFTTDEKKVVVLQKVS